MEARNWNRHIVEKEVSCTIAGAKSLVFLYDLSAGGCMIELPNSAKLLGTPISVVISGYNGTPGIVVWQVGPCCGVRFDTLIDEATVRYVGFTPPELPFDALPPRDRMGHILPSLDPAHYRPNAM